MSICPDNINLIPEDQNIGDALNTINNNFQNLKEESCNIQQELDNIVSVRTFFYYGPNAPTESEAGAWEQDNQLSRPSDSRIESFVNSPSQLNLPSISQVNDVAYVIYQRTGWLSQSNTYIRSGSGTVPFQRTIRVKVVRSIGICFAPGTLVSTPKGNRPIEKLQKGDLVYSFDPVTKEKKTAKVAKTFKGHWKDGKDLSPLFEITHEKGSLLVTGDHWLYTGDINNLFKAAKDYQVGDKVILEDGQESLVTSIEQKEKYEYVYNINVEKYHNFIANGILTGDYQTDSYVTLNKNIENKPKKDSVATPEGFKHIDDIKTGDVIYGFDPGTLELVEQKVKKKTTEKVECVKIIHEHGELIVPKNQRIFVDKQYIDAKKLKPGNYLSILENTEVYTPYYDIESEIISIDYNVFHEVTELSVTGNHNYIFNNVLIHNGGGCFPANTLISTPTGDKKIQEIQAKDIVYGFNYNTHEIGEYEVLKTYEHTWDEVGHTSPLIEIVHEKGTITLTKNHWVYIDAEGNCGEEDKYIEAGDLKVGNYLTLKDNTKSIIQSITDLGSYTKVYNFEVKDVHNYIANNIRVHNGGGGKGGGGRVTWEPRVETYYVGYNWTVNINDIYNTFMPVFIIYRLTYNGTQYVMDSGYPKYNRASTASTNLWNQPEKWTTY